jgi:phosphoglucomutase/phosphomannomutase
MNEYTVRAATQGLANYLNKNVKGEQPSVFISFDSRINSKHFAEETAKVFAANNIKVYIFNELRPVPLVSFGCRYKKCSAAVMITASHNPPEYNGYKVYWSDGAQVLPPHDAGIIEEVNKIVDVNQVKIADANSPLINHIADEVDNAYLDAISTLQHYPDMNASEGKNLKVVYTPLHGTGITMVPKALKRWGFTNLYIVEKQMHPDGHFPTVKSPNPEYRETLKMGIDALLDQNGDILLGTDPDTDRVGVAVKHHNGVVILTGNQVGALCLEHICKALTDTHKMPKKPACIKSIVTTELMKPIAKRYNVTCIEVLSGFKYDGEKIRQWEEDPNGYQFIFGAEDSYGYLLGTFSRDKDAIVSSALICEMALQAKQEGKTLIDKLHDLYNTYGVYEEKLVSVDFEESKTGRDKMKKAMTLLRSEIPTKMLGTPVKIVEDYTTSVRTYVNDGKTEKITLPKSNVLRFYLADDTIITVRPSGTEPKVKLYSSVTIKPGKDLAMAIEHCTVLSDEYLKTLKNLLLS